MEPIEVMMSRPGEPLWFEEDDLIREAMEDTLPEMEIIIENECIV